MAELEERGEWWLPTRPGTRVPGTLRFTPTEGAELTLIGELSSFLDDADVRDEEGTITRRMTADALERSGTYPRILAVRDRHELGFERRPATPDFVALRGWCLKLGEF